MSRLNGRARLLAAIIAAAVLAFVVTTIVVKVQPAKYSADALVDVRNLVGDADAFSTPEKSERMLANQLLVAESADIRGAVASDLGIPQDDVTAQLNAATVTGTDALRLTRTANTPEDAVNGAKAFAEKYISVSVARQKAALTTERQALATSLAAAQRSSTANDSSGVAAAMRTAQIQALSDQAGTLGAQEAALGGKTPDALIIQQPTAPTHPSGPSAVLLGLLAAAAVLLAAALAWFLRSRVSGEGAHRVPSQRGDADGTDERHGPEHSADLDHRGTRAGVDDRFTGLRERVSAVRGGLTTARREDLAE